MRVMPPEPPRSAKVSDTHPALRAAAESAWCEAYFDYEDDSTHDLAAAAIDRVLGYRELVEAAEALEQQLAVTPRDASTLSHWRGRLRAALDRAKHVK